MNYVDMRTDTLGALFCERAYEDKHEHKLWLFRTSKMFQKIIFKAEPATRFEKNIPLCVRWPVPVFFSTTMTSYLNVCTNLM
jgi:hypothetical protein